MFSFCCGRLKSNTPTIQVQEKNNHMHLIKKYANRKLYNTTEKKYITKDYLSQLIKSGEDVLIIDNETGEDLTASIVSSLIGVKNGEHDQNVSTNLMFQLLRKGSGALTDYTKRYVSLWQDAFTMPEDEIDGLVKKLVKNNEISKSEGNKFKTEITGFTTSLKKWICHTIDKRVDEILGAMNLAKKDQFDTLQSKLNELELKLKRIEQHQNRTTPKSTTPELKTQGLARQLANPVD